VDSHEQVNSISKAMQYVQSINSPWFQIYGDFANLAAFGFDIQSELKAGQGHFVGIHVKDSAPDVVRGIPLSGGIVNFVKAFNTLAGINYSGPFLMEMWHNTSQDPVKTAADSLVKIKKIMSFTDYNTNY
jgi:L-ribulose-5-phosphate 3-epimerase